ncbi:MAG: MCE family protein [Burkholderiaceae bacterium]|nr:MCE family protein [Sulfuritalea sp.]MCF8175366.1 MCE family protein [Burkholderiaceae bacterium]MCF8184843.1 MCE family protein [Polynucleobacter sp.]
MENRSHALAAGIFTILLGIAAGVAIWWLGQSDQSTRTYVLETKGNVTGLNVQAQVRYRGIRAGKVEAIEPDPADPRLILVRFNIDSRFRLTKGNTAQLGYQGVTGLAYVQIEDDGTSSEPLVEKDGEMPRIALRPTLFDTLGEKAGEIVDEISSVSRRLSKLLNDGNVSNFSRTLDNLAVASEGLREMPTLLASMREALSEGNLRNLRQILAHLEKTAGESAPLTSELRELVKSMNLLSQRFDKLAGSVGNELTTATLPRANALMGELVSNSRQLSRVLEGLESNPQMLLFGRGAGLPGPGEPGFSAPEKQGEKQ